jgi:membrane protein
MVWIYLSWMIVLLGLEMTYATQNLRTIRQDLRGKRINFASIEFIAVTVLLFVSRRFYTGKRALGQEELASYLDVPPRLLRTILEELARLGFVVATTHENDVAGYQPAKALEKIRMHDVIRGLAVDGSDYNRLRNSCERRVVAGLEETLLVAEREALDDMTLRDLVLRAEAADSQSSEEVGDAG